MEGNLAYGGLSLGMNWYNIARDLATLNAKNEEVTDRAGHLYGYLADVTVAAGSNATISFITAPNTWKVRNAIRKAHFLRDEMFRSAGITEGEQGKYGKTIRPHLDTSMVNSTTYKTPFTFTGAGGGRSYTGGDWTYSSLASSPSWDNTPLEDHDGLEMADTYTLAICGSNVQQADAGGIKTWSTIGLVNSYNIDRLESIPDATADTAIPGTNNPFAMLKSQSVVSGEVAEIAEDQQLEAPPYDVTDDGDSVQLVRRNTVITNSTESVRRVSMFIPAGLLAIYSTAALSSSAVTFNIVGKVLCKDMS